MNLKLLFIALFTSICALSQNTPSEDIDILYKDMNGLKSNLETINLNIQRGSDYLIKSDRLNYLGFICFGATTVTSFMMWNNGYDEAPIVLGIGLGLGTGFTIGSGILRNKGYRELNKGF